MHTCEIMNKDNITNLPKRKEHASLIKVNVSIV